MQAMALRATEFTCEKPFNICVGTWNVNGGRNFRSIAFKVLIGASTPKKY